MTRLPKVWAPVSAPPVQQNSPAQDVSTASTAWSGQGSPSCLWQPGRDLGAGIGQAQDWEMMATQCLIELKDN